MIETIEDQLESINITGEQPNFPSSKFKLTNPNSKQKHIKKATPHRQNANKGYHLQNPGDDCLSDGTQIYVTEPPL